MSKCWPKGSDRRWRNTRSQILTNNQVNNRGQCTLQIPGVCTGLADTVHHTHGRCATGDDPRYLAAVCTACNLKIGDPTKGPDPRSNPKTHW
jgi:hypothetical protein